MGDFFKGWRRKAGLLTLAMACVCMAGWMRSLVVEDFIEFPIDNDAISGFATERHSLVVCSASYPNSETLPAPGPNHSVSLPSGVSQSEENGKVDLETGAQVVDFTVEIVPFLVIPFWSLVLPLTLLSGWLILGKTRKAKGLP